MQICFKEVEIITCPFCLQNNQIIYFLMPVNRKWINKWKNINKIFIKFHDGININETDNLITINDINGLVKDSDLHVLQENYGYIFWSILAVGLLSVTFNVIRRE